MNLTQLMTIIVVEGHGSFPRKSVAGGVNQNARRRPDAQASERAGEGAGETPAVKALQPGNADRLKLFHVKQSTDARGRLDRVAL